MLQELWFQRRQSIPLIIFKKPDQTTQGHTCLPLAENDQCNEREAKTNKAHLTEEHQGKQ
jgi:hypothetical protein